MATKVAEKKEKTETPAESQDGPLLDMSDQAVKRMIKLAKQRGFVTYEELNEVMPSEEVSSEQIEDTLSMLSEMGINVVETEEETEEQQDGEAAEAEPGLPVKQETKASEPVEGIRENLDELFPQLASTPLVEAWAGMVETTPDVVPVIEETERVPGFYIASGFSGHGFGIGPGAGKAIAGLVTGNDTGIDLSAFRLSRFFDGTPIQPQQSV